ncbi:hypothetical protein [Corynebacterium sphenisci]|uniref:hypothetical protein n=1 Tax=Corynebacterium sphenisci TaxID=191493 RepID=UPI0026E0D2E7|nr:hypothetical protein [Corynebacterium sphenisci]MDO5730894.1 hypothetical protein [Corynebacterium sphenisci]
MTDREDIPDDAGAHEAPGTGGDAAGRETGARGALDLVTTGFYAWIGAGARTVELLGEIGERVRSEEAAKDARERAAAGAGRLGEQSRDAFRRAVAAAQEAFDEALDATRERGDAAFAKADALPDDVAERLARLRPEQLREVADSYLETASRLYRDLAERGERVVQETIPGGPAAGDAAGAPGGAHRDRGRRGGFGRIVDPLGIAGLLRSARTGDAAGAERLAGNVEELAREATRPLREAGEQLRRRMDDEGVTEQVQDALRQAADVTEALLGALRAQAEAGAADAAARAARAADAAAGTGQPEEAEEVEVVEVIDVDVDDEPGAAGAAGEDAR